MEGVCYGTETSVSDIGIMMDVTNPLLSVLAAGVSGSARLHERLGDAEASRAVDRCIKRIERSIEAFAGRILQVGGSEVMAAFDTADAAIHAAIEMQQRIADLPPVSGVKMAIRVGISCCEMSQADEPVDENTAREAAHLAGTAKAGEILAAGKLREQIPQTLFPLVADTGSVLPGESGRNEPIVKITPPEVTAAPATAPSEAGARQADAAAAAGCLRLRYGEETILLNERKSVVSMGRDTVCDVVIRDRRASRHHATIERRGNAVILIDRSTNGTYLTIEGTPEQFLKHTQCTLRGKGLITFASPSSCADADFAEFEFV